jgi:tyrosine phenol-lyase
VKSVYDGRDAVCGLRMVYELRFLRFFQARFQPLDVIATVAHS